MLVVLIDTVSLVVVLAPTWKFSVVASAPSMCLPLKVGAAEHAGDFRLQLAEFLVQRVLVGRAVGGVARLHRQLAHALQRVARPGPARRRRSAPARCRRWSCGWPRSCRALAQFMRSAMDRPAASSLAELMRRPDDRRCIDVASDDCELDRLRWASIEAMLVLIERVMMFTPGETKSGGIAGLFAPKSKTVGAVNWFSEGRSKDLRTF